MGCYIVQERAGSGWPWYEAMDSDSLADAVEKARQHAQETEKDVQVIQVHAIILDDETARKPMHEILGLRQGEDFPSSLR